MPELLVRVALAGRVLMSALRLSARRGAAPAAAVGVPGVRASDVADGGDGDARHPHAAAGVVLGGLPGGHPPPGDLGGAVKRQLGIARYDTAWLILHKLRRAMVAPEREPLTGPVEVDDFSVGGIEEGHGGGRKSDSSKAIVAAAVGLRGAGSGPARRALPAQRSWRQGFRRPCDSHRART